MPKMPVLFMGHGSPMNAIEDNEYTRQWVKIAAEIPRPTAILSVSAHWVTDGTRILGEKHPRMIYDMYGFPRKLYQVQYKAEGSPELAANTLELLKGNSAQLDNEWGYDHGTWSVLHVMYPEADIPVYQLSLDLHLEAKVHFEIGQKLQVLRDQGVLIMGSGNVVHNLSMLNFNSSGGYDWAETFDNYIKDKIISRDYAKVIDYRQAGTSANHAFVTTEHFYPLLYVLGASMSDDQLRVYNDSCTMGSISMTCYLLG